MNEEFIKEKSAKFEMAPEDFKDILENAFNDIEQQMRDLTEALNKTDQPTIKKMTHAMKGVLAFFGIDTLDALALDLDQLADEQADLNKIKFKFECLKQEYNNFKAEIGAT